MRAAISIKENNKRPESPSYMADVSPHRHVKSYDDDWVHEPLSRISHLSVDSITFALNLRPEEKKHVGEEKKNLKTIQNVLNNGKHKSVGKCFSNSCVHRDKEIIAFVNKNEKLKNLIKLKEEELAVEEGDAVVIERKLAIQQKSHADVITKLYIDKIVEKKRNLPKKLEEKRIEYNKLLLEVETRVKLVLHLKREYAKSVFARGDLFSENIETYPPADKDMIFQKVKEPKRNKNDNEKYFHTGKFMRSAQSNWEASWTCCLSSDSHSQGCQIKSTAESSLKLSESLKKLKENKSITVDTWAKRRLEEAPVIRPLLHQWSSPTLKQTVSMKPFDRSSSRLGKSDSKVTISKPIF